MAAIDHPDKKDVGLFRTIKPAATHDPGQWYGCF
jgi:hypothetical protein